MNQPFKRPTKGQIIASTLESSPTPLDIYEIKRRVAAITGSVTANMVRTTCDYLVRIGDARRDHSGRLIRYAWRRD